MNALIDIIENHKLSIIDKMTMVGNIKEILKSSSSEAEAAETLTLSFENFFNQKLEEIKESLELRNEGEFSTGNKKSLFKRVT